MKNIPKIILSSFFIAPLFFPVSTLAISINPTASQVRTQIQDNRQEIIQDRVDNRQEIHEQIQENRQDIEDKRASAAAEKKALLNQLKLKVIQKIQNRIRQKLVNRFKRLQKAQVALKAKIEQRNQDGLDVTSAQTELAKVDQYITNYQSQLKAYDDLVVQMNQSETPIQYRNQLSNQAKLINKELISYNQVLRQTIKLIINLANI